MSEFEKADRRPWRLSAPSDTTIISDDGEVAEALGDYDNFDAYPRMEANVALITEAVNSYDAHLARIAALESLLRELRSRFTGPVYQPAINDLLARTDAALAGSDAP